MVTFSGVEETVLPSLEKRTTYVLIKIIAT